MASLDEELLAQQLQNAGPASLPYVRRSAYLADALSKLNESAAKNGINSGGALVTNLLADALLEFQRKRNDRKLAAAQEADRARDDAAWQAMFAGQDGAQAPQSPAQPEQPAPAPQAPTPAPMASTGPPPDWDAVGRSKERLVRLLMGEAGGNDAGQRAVASVVMNRANSSGLNLDQVMNAPHQFEPLNNPTTLARLSAIPWNDPRFQQANRNADAVLNNGPTTNADHFWSPTAQAALGRQPPAWAGPGQNIGGNVFSRLGYSAPSGMQGGNASLPSPPPQMAQLPPGAQPAAYNPPAPVPSAGAGAPPAPVPSSSVGGNPQGPQTRGLNSITPEQRALVSRLLQSNDPRERARGQAMMQQLLAQAAAPVEWAVTTVNGVPVYYDKQNPSRSFVGQVPQGAMSSQVTAQQAGIPAPQGTTYNRDPAGNLTSVYQPQAGFQSAPGGGQTYVRGGSADPAAGLNLVQGEAALRQRYDAEVQPAIDAIQGYKKVLQAVRTGSPAGDVAMVFAFMKTLDPTSTVREGEQATVQNSGTIPQTILNTYNQLITGNGRMSPEQRIQFANAAYQQVQVAAQRAAQLNERYGGMARDYGYNPGHVIQNFGQLEAPPALAPPSPTAAPQQQQAPAPQTQSTAGTVGFNGQFPIFTPEQAAAAARNPANKGKAFYLKGNPNRQYFQ